MVSNNIQATLNLLDRSRLSHQMTHALINVESLVGDVHINLGTHHLFTMTMSVLRIKKIQSDDHCKSWTRFKKGELSDLTRRLGFEERVCIENTPGNFYRFHRE